MITAPIPENEKQRLEELYRYELLDTETEAEFDELVQLASQICGAHISCVSLIDSDRQWLKAKTGLDVSETERSISFCGHAILKDELMEVPDTSKDNRFHDNPLVTGDPHIRFYAGMPLITPRGYNVGTLCVIDEKPKELNPEQMFAMKVLANQAMKLMELRLQRKELQHALKVQNRLISIIAHDVRNPLASLKSILELKNEGILDNEQADEMLQLSGKQMLATIDMVNNLVDWGKLQMKYDRLPSQKVNLHKLVNQCVETNEIGFTLKNNDFQNKVPQDLLIHTDPQALTFIVRNLVGNSNKFTENGKISVEAHREDNTIVMCVSDTGIGMPPETATQLLTQEKIYSRPGTQQEVGNGLGLVLVREFLQNIRGRLEISSNEQGGGTQVCIYLPVKS